MSDVEREWRFYVDDMIADIVKSESAKWKWVIEVSGARTD